MKLEISDWNMIPYAGAWSRQTEWFDALVHAKQAGEGYVNHIVLCEHPHVYTLGRSGKERNMLLGEEQLRRIGATLYHIDRGGDITYHGPGQLVCYPILNLEDFSLGLKEYVHLLEEAVIRVCASFGIAYKITQLYFSVRTGKEYMCQIVHDKRFTSSLQRRSFTSSIGTSCPSSFCKEVTPLSMNPQGLI